MVAGPFEHSLQAALETIAPQGVRVGVLAIDSCYLSGLFDVERRHISTARGTRQHEFATGRELLRRLFGERFEIAVLASRAPAIPIGMAATLAHDRDVAVAAVGSAPAFTALGIDVEPVGEMTLDEAATVLRADETGLDPRLGFVLKEAAYKAWSGLGGGPLDFHDVRVALADDHYLATILPTGRVLTGRWVEIGERYLALVAC